MLRRLLQDPVIRLMLVVVAFGLAPVLVPALSARPLWIFAALSTEIPLILVAIAAFQLHLRRLPAAADRRFWHLWTLAFLLWLVRALFRLFAMPIGAPSVGAEIASTGLSFGFYLSLAIALENRLMARPAPPSRNLRSLERIGTFAFIGGLLVYFAVAPGVLDISAYWRSSVAWDVALDGYLAYRMFGMWRGAPDPAWRRSFFWLTWTALLWLLSDTVEMWIWAGLPGADPVTPLRLLWIPALVTTIVAARSHYQPVTTGRVGASELARTSLAGPLVVYAVAFPLLHFLFYRLPIADASLKPIREIVALSFLMVLSALGAGYLEILRRDNAALESERLAAQARVEHQAYHDALTNLPNRLLLNDRLRVSLARAERQESVIAVLFLDLDNFKLINDSLGHVVGDRLLVAAAGRLASAVRPGDTVARVGGDEFLILVEQLGQSTDAAKVAQNLLEAFQPHFDLDGHDYHVTASIGVAVFPDDGGDEVTLVKNADAAMYEAKRQGRNGYRLFTPAMNAMAMERLAMEEDLRGAVSRDELFNVYQPVVELATGRIVGAESLVRWRHPERGTLLPGAFIGVAEASGLILEVGKWTLEESFRQQVRWQEKGIDLVLAANLSASQLHDPTFVDFVAGLIRSTRVDPTRIELEVTESMAIDKQREVIACLSSLRDLGVRIALDDFGTDYSSLGRLRTLPIDVLKIDRSFVNEVDLDPQDTAIVAAVNAMATAMELEVIAEGVERPEQLDRLIEIGCGRGQGYLFSRPVQAGRLEVLYRASVDG